MSSSTVVYDMAIFLTADLFTTAFIRRFIPLERSNIPIIISGILLAFFLYQKHDQKKNIMYAEV